MDDLTTPSNRADSYVRIYTEKRLTCHIVGGNESVKNGRRVGRLKRRVVGIIKRAIAIGEMVVVEVV